MYVYFIKTCDNKQLVKIGKATDVDKRLSQLQTGNGSTLAVVGKIKCDSEEEALTLESTIHKAFSNLRIRGEWFRWSVNLRNFIKAVEDGKDFAAKRALANNKRQAIRKHHHKNDIQVGEDFYDFKAVKNVVSQMLHIKQTASNEEFMEAINQAGFKGSQEKRLTDALLVALHKGYLYQVAVKAA